MMHLDLPPEVHPAHHTDDLAPDLKLLLLQEALATLDEVATVLQEEAQRQRQRSQEVS